MKIYEKTSTAQSENVNLMKKAKPCVIRQLNDSEAKLVGGAISVRVPPPRSAPHG